MKFPNENPKFVGFVVYKQGDNGTLFYIIFTGSVKVFQVCLFFFLKNKCANQHFEVLHLISHLWKLTSLVKISMFDPIPHQFDHGFCNVK
jgi:hypothetical protein